MGWMDVRTDMEGQPENMLPSATAFTGVEA